MMTVVVSIVAGVVAITSAIPSPPTSTGWSLSMLFVVLVTLANLRGVRESGTLFAIPTYGFIICDPHRWSASGSFAVRRRVSLRAGRRRIRCPMPRRRWRPIGLFTILQAFSSGATALTGVEAISNGVPAFRRPQARNAAQTLAMMGVIAITMFLGISWLVDPRRRRHRQRAAIGGGADRARRSSGRAAWGSSSCRSSRRRS